MIIVGLRYKKYNSKDYNEKTKAYITIGFNLGTMEI